MYMRKEMETETVTVVQTVHGMCVIVDRTALSQLSPQTRIRLLSNKHHLPHFQVCVCVCVCVEWESLLGERASLKLHPECIMGRTGAQRASEVDLNAAHIEVCTDSNPSRSTRESIVGLYTCSDLWTQPERSLLTTADFSLIKSHKVHMTEQGSASLAAVRPCARERQFLAQKCYSKP